MRKSILWKMLVVIQAVLLPTMIFASKPPDDAQKTKVINKAYRMQIPFMENKGQIESKDVSFYAKTFGGTIFVEKDGTLTYNLPFEDKGGIVIKEVFTNKKVDVKGLEPSPTKINYFKGKDKNKWKSNIPSYNSISLGEVYKGVNLTLKAYGNNVEKLFTVLPKEKPELIKVKLQGAKGLKVNEKGELEVITEHDSVKFTKPVAYQEIGGKNKSVEVAYAIYKGTTYGFKVGSYDKKRPLIIDPLLASTYIGTSSSDSGFSITLNESGDVYVTGTSSYNYPTTSGAYDESFNGGGYDSFISKLDSSLSTLLASTFIGGSSSDTITSLALDESGNVYVTGWTDASDYPTTTGAYDESYNGGYDSFISKLDSNLSSLLASTFIGGGSAENGLIALDESGNVYVTGSTASSDYPTTPGAYDENHNGYYDVFISKLDNNLSADPVIDSDGDGVPDDEDSCPFEDATGFDVDEDGCIDSVIGLTSIVEILVDESVIDEQMQSSLLSKIDNASQSADKENICAAVNQLEALINQVNAQRGKKISDEAADQVIAYTQSVIDWYLDQLPEEETCL